MRSLDTLKTMQNDAQSAAAFDDIMSELVLQVEAKLKEETARLKNDITFLNNEIVKYQKHSLNDKHRYDKLEKQYDEIKGQLYEHNAISKGVIVQASFEKYQQDPTFDHYVLPEDNYIVEIRRLIQIISDLKWKTNEWRKLHEKEAAKNKELEQVAEVLRFKHPNPNRAEYIKKREGFTREKLIAESDRMLDSLYYHGWMIGELRACCCHESGYKLRYENLIRESKLEKEAAEDRIRILENNVRNWKRTCDDQTSDLSRRTIQINKELSINSNLKDDLLKAKEKTDQQERTISDLKRQLAAQQKENDELHKKYYDRLLMGK